MTISTDQIQWPLKCQKTQKTKQKKAKNSHVQLEAKKNICLIFWLHLVESQIKYTNSCFRNITCTFGMCNAVTKKLNRSKFIGCTFCADSVGLTMRCVECGSHININFQKNNKCAATAEDMKR